MDRVEQIAKAIHDGWWVHQLDRGVQLGPRTEMRTSHPHMLPWSALDDEAKNQDRFMASIILAEWMAGTPITCQMIHEAWRVWEKLHARKHPHDKPYKEAHAAKKQTYRKKVIIDDREHLRQLRRIEVLLEKWNKNVRPD
jgi:hypothetical protein